MASTQSRKYFQEPLFDELRKDYCYVCFKKIKTGDGVNIGNNTWRHRKCKPGSTSWLKSPVGRGTASTDIPKSAPTP